MRSLAIVMVLILATAPAWGQAFTEDFNAGIPAGWTIVDNTGGTGPIWDTNVAWGDDNWTGGDGMCADVNSDTYGTADFDTELITPSFTVPDEATLVYDTNYQNYANEDFADTDIDVGVGWVNLLQWNEDHGGFKALPGENVIIDLSAYAGATARVRFHYYNPAPDDWEWYWEVDNVQVTGEVPVEETSWGSIKAMFR